MSDDLDLDELERRAKEPFTAVFRSEVLALISRCRTAEAEVAEIEIITNRVKDEKCQSAERHCACVPRLRAAVDRLKHKWKDATNDAEMSWGCVQEVRKVLEHFGKACKPQETGEGTAPMFYREWLLAILARFHQEAARWPEAVAKVRARNVIVHPEHGSPCAADDYAKIVRLTCDELTRLATEERDKEKWIRRMADAEDKCESVAVGPTFAGKTCELCGGSGVCRRCDDKVMKKGESDGDNRNDT